MTLLDLTLAKLFWDVVYLVDASAPVYILGLSCLSGASFLDYVFTGTPFSIGAAISVALMATPSLVFDFAASLGL